MTYIAINTWDLSIGALLILFSGGLSILLSLKLEKQLFIAALRCVVQLLLLGFILKLLFQHVSLMWTGLTVLVMIFFAAYEIQARQEYRLRSWWNYGLGAASVFFATILITLLALLTQIKPTPWYDPRFAIPLLGMILGNTMTGISVAMNSFSTYIIKDSYAIEARLALGATRFEALSVPIRSAIKNGLIPLINMMATAGVVSIPGLMTGQLLAGASPIEAAKYQILVLFLIAGSTTLGVLAAIFACAYRITDNRHRLRLDRMNQ